MTRNRLRTLGCALVLAVAGAACSDSGGSSTTATTVAYDASKGVDSPAAALRSAFTGLLQEHVLLTGVVTGEELAGRDPVPAAAVLDANSSDLAGVLVKQYGGPAGAAFLPVWRAHIGVVRTYGLATKAGDKAAADAAKADLEAFVTEVGAELNGLNKQLTAAAVGDELKAYVTAMLAAVGAQAKGDATATTKLKTAADHMATTAIVLTAGIIKDRGPDALSGKVDGLGSVIRAELTAKLQEHVYLTGATTRTIIAGADAKPPSEALDENTVELSNVISSVYGDDAAGAFLKLWRRQVGALADYARGAKGGDRATLASARAELDEARAGLAAALHEDDPELAEEDVSTELARHVEALTAAVDAQASGAPGAVATLRAAATRTSGTALVLAESIARQFPAKFG